MDVPREAFYRRDESETMIDVRATTSRRGDFDPSLERYAHDTYYSEALTVLEAWMVEGEVLA